MKVLPNFFYYSQKNQVKDKLDLDHTKEIVAALSTLTKYLDDVRFRTLPKRLLLQEIKFLYRRFHVLYILFLSSRSIVFIKKN
jgi:hypothetical protein